MQSVLSIAKISRQDLFLNTCGLPPTFSKHTIMQTIFQSAVVHIGNGKIKLSITKVKKSFDANALDVF